MPFGQPKFEKSPEAPQEAPGQDIETPEEKEISLEEKARAVSDFIFKEHINSFPFDYHKDKVKRAFAGKTPEALESVLGGKEIMQLLYGAISERRKLLGQMAENQLAEDELRDFMEKNGRDMLPQVIGDSLHAIDYGFLRIVDFLTMKTMISAGKKLEGPEGQEVGDYATQTLRDVLLKLMGQNEKWQTYSRFEKKKETKPVEIKGFEKFDRPNIKGEDMIKIALEMLPSGRLSANVTSVEYRDEAKPMDAKYGFEGEAAASFIEQEGKILLYKIPDRESPEKYFVNVPLVLFHEWGHSLDPRLIDQKDLPPAEQLRMIKKWERIRSEEEEWSSYVLKIKNQDMMREPLIKSYESLAESIAYFLYNHYLFRELHPKRYAFIEALIKKRFPEFDFGRRSDARKFYRVCLVSGFPRTEEEKEDVDKFLNEAEK